MLNSLRESSGSWVVKIFLGLLVMSFAIWGIGDIFRFQPGAEVVTVGDREISGQQFLDRFNRDVRRMQAQFGPTFDQAQARRLGMVDQVVQQFVTEALYDQQAHDLDLIASDSDVLVEIQQSPAFKDSFGNFSRLVFEQRIRNNNQTEQSFVSSLQQDIVRNQLLEAIAVTPQGPKSMLDAMYSYQQEKRVLEILSISHDAMSVPEQPGEDALVAYHQAHQEEFTAPEYRRLTFLTLRPEDVAETVTVDESELRDSYQSRSAEFTTEGARTVEQVVVQDEAVANQIIERLDNGDDFYAVAKEVADADKETVALGELRREEMPDAIGDPVFALNTGEYGGPIESPFGWHVFRVLDSKQGGTRSFEEVRDQILSDLRHERASDIIYDLSNSVEDQLAAGRTVEEIAENLGLTHGRVAAVDASGRGRDGEPDDGLPTIPGLLSAAFTSDVGEEPTLQQSVDGNYYLVRVDEIMPSALRPLEEVRADVLAKVIDERKASIAKAEAEALLQTVKGGTPLADLSRGPGRSLLTTQPLIRTQSQASGNLTGDLATAVYALPTGGTVTGVSRDGKAHLVVTVKDIQEADASENAPGRTQLRQFLSQSITEDLVEQFTEALRQKYDVEINDGQIDALFDEANVRG